MNKRHALKRFAVVTAITSALARSGVAHATIDMFFKIADIQGESTDSQHMHEIDVLAFSWGVGGDSGQPAMRPQQPGVAARACVSGFLLTKYIDSTTPDLLQTAISGRVY
jgi:type VI protein secretion system component Hcp